MENLKESVFGGEKFYWHLKLTGFVFGRWIIYDIMYLCCKSVEYNYTSRTDSLKNGNALLFSFLIMATHVLSYILYI